MTTRKTDIVVSGAGIAGLVAAAAMAHAGFSVALLDPQADTANSAADPLADLRSTAFLRPARDLLDEIGLWSGLAPHATPLESLRIIDTAGWPPKPGETRVFRATDLEEAAFGWNLPNWHTRAILIEHLNAQPDVHMMLGTGFDSILTRETEAFVTLTDGDRLRARLVIGADGRNSAVRDAVGIDVDVTRYGQKALAFAVSHAHAHDNISTEIYNQGGAFTTVPLPDHDGAPASAIVWMNDGPRAVALRSMQPEDFLRELNARSTGILGPMQPVTRLALWPVVTQTARALTAQRTALIAEAAHVLPPIGAQGLNTSLHDVATLYDLARGDADALGTRAMLERYEKARHRDIARRARVIDLFNRICRSGEAPIQALRSVGLRALYDLAPLRKSVMRAGLGAASGRAS